MPPRCSAPRSFTSVTWGPARPSATWRRRASPSASIRDNARTMFSLDDLAKIIASRVGAVDSYTAQLLAAGPEKCAKKLGEEAVETVLAATGGNQQALVAESAGLLYPLLVVLEARGAKLAEVSAELERRTARSGLQEKAARQGK